MAKSLRDSRRTAPATDLSFRPPSRNPQNKNRLLSKAVFSWLACKPNSVYDAFAAYGDHLSWAAIARGLMRATKSCSCTGEGFPRRLSRGGPAWALTPRFQPYLPRIAAETRPSCDGFRRCIFCCTFPGLGASRVFSSLAHPRNGSIPCSRPPLAALHFLQTCV